MSQADSMKTLYVAIHHSIVLANVCQSVNNTTNPFTDELGMCVQQNTVNGE